MFVAKILNVFNENIKIMVLKAKKKKKMISTQ